MLPKRGEIWLVNLDPTVGSEIQKTRPAVVISSDYIGKLPLKLVVPITDWKDSFSSDILQGEAVMELDDHEFVLRMQQGIEIPPGVAHQFRNESNAEVRFLVISVPKAHGDRVTI